MSTDAVIKASPMAMAVTVPLLSTDTISGADELQVRVTSISSGDVSAVSV